MTIPRWVVPRVARLLVVDPDTGCWAWQGGLTPQGYGCTSKGSRTDGTRRTSVPVHRWVYAMSGRPIPAGYVLDHVCHDPSSCAGGPTCPHRRCANPAHLRAVLPADNVSPARSVMPYAFRDGHCRNGHDVSTPDRVYVYPDGRGRACRACRAEGRRAS